MRGSRMESEMISPLAGALLEKNQLNEGRPPVSLPRLAGEEAQSEGGRA